MPGIAGIARFHRPKGAPLQLAVAQMLKVLRHRGKAGQRQLLVKNDRSPILSDGSGKEQLHDEIQIALGHCEHTTSFPQPICDTQKRYFLLLDGDIYNRAALQKELQAAGGSIRNDSSAELLLQAYIHWGADCLQKLNGRWAFVLWDRTKHRLFGSRDRTGVKPFYYYSDKEHWAFASEQKALLQLPFLSPKLNPTAAFDLLILNHVPSDQDFFAGIKALPPAHYFQLDLETQQMELNRYFTPQVNLSFPKYQEADFQKHTQQVRELLQTAVAKRLQQIPTTGSLLSGGIDSSVLISCFRQLKPKATIKAFTTYFDEPKLDESHWAEMMAQQVNAEWHRTSPSYKAFREELETLAYCQDSPLTSTGTYAQFCAMRLAASQGINHVLDGQGADALFAGHLPHQTALWRGLLSCGRLQTLAQEMQSFGGIGKGLSYLARNVTKYSLLPTLPKGLKLFFDKHYFGELSLFQPDFIESESKRYDAYREDGMQNMNSMLSQAYFGDGMQYLLKCVDRSSNWHSVDAITPYADDLDLMNYLFSIPATFKLKDGVSKRLLREAFKRELPEAIYGRTDKMALASPNNRWLGSLNEDIRQMVSEQDDQIFNKQELLRRMDQLLQPTQSQENYRLFKYAGFVIWRKVFGV